MLEGCDVWQRGGACKGELGKDAKKTERKWGVECPEREDQGLYISIVLINTLTQALQEGRVCFPTAPDC